MSDINITIPNPTVTGVPPDAFAWSLFTEPDDSLIDSGVTDNSVFTLTGLDAGDYKILMYLQSAGVDSAVGYCFTIQPDAPANVCFCPLITAEYIEADGISNIKLSLDLPNGFPSCPLTIIIFSAQTNGGTLVELIIYDSSQLNFDGGTAYSITIPVPLYDTYDVVVTDGDGLKCLNIQVKSTEVGKLSCFRANSIGAELIRDSDDLIHILLHIAGQPSPPPFTTLTVTWLEFYGGDSGSQTITLSPTDVPPYDYQINPNLTPTNAWTNSFGGLYHNKYAINIYSGCNFYAYFEIEAPAP